MSGGSELSGFSMFELFKAEAETQCALLSEGLLAVESNPDDLARIEPLMRAAHSTKGAARIIGLDLIVRLAHAMEDCLVAAQKGQERLGSERIDQLLQGVDSIGQVTSVSESELPTWSEENTQRIEELITAINAPPPAAPESPTPPEPPAVEPPAPATPPEEQVDVEPAGDTGATRAEPAPPVTGVAESAFVRVGADRLNRLMQLAGESVVESRRFQSFRKSLAQVRDGQRRLGAALEAARLRSADADGLGVIRDAAAGMQEQIQQHADSLEEALRRAELLSSELYHEVLSSRMRPFSEGTAGFPRMVRDLARDIGKKVTFEVLGGDVAVDRDVLSRLEAPLNHMIRNSVDHGIESPEARRAAGKPETGHVELEARHHAGSLVVQLRDDGRGVDPDKVRRRAVERGVVDASLAEALSTEETLEFIFLPGFSTAGAVTEISGRGVGLDVVQSMVHEISGAVHVASEPGRSTTFTMRLPITLSVVRAAIVEIAGEPYAFPLMHLGRMLRLGLDELTPVEGRQQFTHEGRSVGLAPAAELLDLEPDGHQDEHISVMVLGDDERQCGVVVDRFLGEQDLVVRPLDTRLGKVPHILAAAMLDDGAPVLIVDSEDLMQSVQQLLQEGRLRKAPTARAAKDRTRRRVLVVDDSITVREVERQLLTQHGCDVDVAVDGQDGWNALKTSRYDLLVTDVDMPRMNGIELIRLVRRDPQLASLPVIIVSYKDRKEDRMRGMEAGANAYLTKHSFHDDSLVKMVHDLTESGEE